MSDKKKLTIQDVFKVVEGSHAEARQIKLNGKFTFEVSYQDGVLQRVNDTRTRYGLSPVAAN